MKIYIIVILLIFGTVTAFGQKERKYIRQGNHYYNKAVEKSDSTAIDSVDFSKAEIDYRRALEKKPGDFKSQFNIGNALFKQRKMAEAESQYQQILESGLNKEDKGKTWFNYGNSLLGQQKFDESINAYKNALRNNPSDVAAKYNLEFARRMKQQQQQQQKQQNKDNKDQKDKDQQNKDQDKNQQNQDKNKDQQNKDQQNKDQNQQNQQNQNKNQQQQQQPKISKQAAEQMLKALQNDEKQTQEKVKKAEAMKAKSTRPDKDW